MRVLRGDCGCSLRVWESTLADKVALSHFGKVALVGPDRSKSDGWTVGGPPRSNPSSCILIAKHRLRARAGRAPTADHHGQQKVYDFGLAVCARPFIGGFAFSVTVSRSESSCFLSALNLPSGAFAGTSASLATMPSTLNVVVLTKSHNVSRASDVLSASRNSSVVTLPSG